MISSLQESSDAIRAAGLGASTLLAAIAAIHVYWVAGGSWGTNAGLGGRDIDIHSVPWRIGTALIALGLVGAALVVVAKADLLHVGVGTNILTWATWVVAAGLLFGGVVNVFGRTWLERLGFAPLALGLGVLVTLVALSRLNEAGTS
ncbi:MAG: DUF3995 domain-containing protein [Gaiellaceae bacterium]